MDVIQFSILFPFSPPFAFESKSWITMRLKVGLEVGEGKENTTLCSTRPLELEIELDLDCAGGSIWSRQTIDSVGCSKKSARVDSNRLARWKPLYICQLKVGARIRSSA